ncbi:hypothetical protein KBZ21_39700, partial [Streptomyces sp. A73]|nr:hypothetical protein [Streptomyces sp. A73]
TPPGYHHRTVGPLEPGDAWFIARHSPARVLAEVDAKRGLLDRDAEVADMDYEDNEPEYAYGRATGLGEAVRLLALPYASHPD